MKGAEVLNVFLPINHRLKILEPSASKGENSWFYETADGIKVDLSMKEGFNKDLNRPEIGLFNIDVAKEGRGKGIGTDIVNALIKYADSKGKVLQIYSPTKKASNDFWSNFSFKVDRFGRMEYSPKQKKAKGKGRFKCAVHNRMCEFYNRGRCFSQQACSYKKQ